MEGDWRNSANCKTVDPELFFPTGEKSGFDLDQIDKAKAVCMGCAVLSQCLEYALETNQEFGIWGGMSATERKNFKRRQRRNYR